MRENAIYLMGMGHPLIRRMFQEISARLIRGGVTSHLDDIYWLTKSELEKLIVQLDENIPLSNRSNAILARKTELKKIPGVCAASSVT